MSEEKVPLWRDERVIAIVAQLLVVVLLLIAIAILGNNLVTNLRKLGIPFGFDFLDRPASFGIGDKAIPYQSTDPYSKAILVGLLNSVRVMIIGIILSTIVGIIVGIAKLADNWLVRQIANVFVEVLRNTPLLLQLFFWYFVVFLKLPKIENPLVLPGPIFLTNKGLDLPWPAFNTQTWLSLAFLLISVVLAVIVWQRRIDIMIQTGQSGQNLLIVFIVIVTLALLVLVFGLGWQSPRLDAQAGEIEGGLNLSVELGTLVTGLTMYTAAYIAECVRAGIQSVGKGQWEAGKALGLKANVLMQMVIFPQALRVMIPPVTSEFLNLAKNSSLAIAIGYNDIYAISSTIANQTGKSVEMLLVVMGTYLLINLIISTFMNWFNSSVQLRER